MARVRVLTLLAAIALLAGLWPAAVSDARAVSPAPVVTPSTPDISPHPPSPPGDLRAVAVTAGSVTLAWNASTGGCCGVAGYDVTYTEAFNDVVRTQDVGDVTTVTLRSSIRPATQYSFWVSARDGVGHRSAASNAVTVVTPLSDTGPDRTPPTAPADLTLTGVTAAGAALTWSASADDVGVTGYQVYRFDGLYISTLLATVTGTSYTARLASARDIFYVRARDAAGNVSIASHPVTVTSTPTTPQPQAPCSATYAIGSQWAGGFVASLTVSNPGPAPLDGWTVTFRFGGDQRIATAWNATADQAGAEVTLTNLDWNRVLPAGGSTSLGLLGGWSASNAPPTDISCTARNAGSR